MTGDEYIDVLKQRRDQWLAEHPARPHDAAITPKFETPALLSWFVRAGDEDLVELPEREKPAPKADAKPAPRTRSTVDTAALVAQRDALVAQRDRIAGDGPVDRACANLSPSSRNRAAASAGRRRFVAMDRDLARYTELAKRIKVLDQRIAVAQRRQ
jgi:hypothetical protein